MRAYRHFLLVVLVLCLGFVLHASLPQVATGTWSSLGSSMGTVRSGAVSVLLFDGRVLIIGGSDPNGLPLATTEFLNTDGTLTPGPTMSAPRAGHAALWLMNGEVLVTGGISTVGGSASNSVEVFDPLNPQNGWMPLSAMPNARAGHTMTQLQDGSVLIAGGENSGGLVSALDVLELAPTEHFVSAGTLLTARKGHAAAVLNDGRMLIAGGVDANGATLASTEIFNPAALTGTALEFVTAGPDLSSPRAYATATALLDGSVLVAGGSYPEGAANNGGAAELASADVIDPAATTVIARPTMSTERSGHMAFLLPNNNSVLIAGGSAAGVDLKSAELYIPWTGQFQATGDMNIARSNATGAAMGGAPAIPGIDGLLMVAGGTNQSSGELYGFATVKTDQGDYAPGQTVTITGAGWQPGETVMLTLVESPNVDTHEPMMLVADAFGRISNSSFVTDIHDLNIRFYLTAIGSAAQAQNTFTDGTPRIEDVSNSPFSPNQASSAGVFDTTTISAKNQGGGSIADFRIRIRAGSTGGTLVREFSCGSISANGTCLKIWDGKDSTSAFVVDGTYIALASNGTTETTSPASNTGTIVVDNTNPTVTLTSPANNAFVRGNNTPLLANPTDVGGDDSNIDKVEFYVDGSLAGTDTGPGGGWNFNLNTTTLSDGDHTCSAKAFDKAGNNASSSSRTLKVDNTSPTVSVDPVSNGTVNTPITITGNSSDLPAIAGYGVASVQVTISGAANNTGAAINTGTNFSTWSYSFTPTVGGNYSVAAKATDQAGNFENSSPVNFTVTADSTPPVITPNVSGTQGSNNWYTSDVTVTWTISDPESTIISSTGCGSTTINSDSAGMTLTCVATSSGGTASQSVTIKRDATPPSASLSVTAGTLGSNGWYTSDVTVSTSGTDSISGPVTCTADQFQTTENTGQVFNGSCTNEAGLTTDAAPLTIKLDKTGPAATLAVTAGAAGTNGWYTSDVTVSTSGSDSISGPVNCTADQFQTTETVGQVFNGSCTNDAGLTTDAAPLTVKLDKTAPSAALAVISGTAGANSWYISDVTLQASGADTISSPVICSPDAIVSTETAGQDVTLSCTNDAGLSADTNTIHIKLDKTGPSANLAVTAGTAGANGWYTSDVTVSTSGSDSISSPVTCTANQYQTSETTGTVFNGSCTNDAGLTTDAASLTVKLDKTGPSAVLAVSAGTLGDNGWYTSNVTVNASGVDTISSPVVCTADQFLSTDSSGTTFNGSCTNDAGLTTDAAALTVKRDATPPVVGVTGVSNGASYTLGAVPAAGCTTSDATSGVAEYASLSLTGGVPPGVGSFTAACNGAKDSAGNTNFASIVYNVFYSTAACLGSPGHSILQPVNADGTSVFKQKSTVPAKFRVCDANGVSIGTTGVVSSFRLTEIYNGTVPSPVDEAVESTTPDSAFRWSATDQQWIFNINTKGYQSGKTYRFHITLNDGTGIEFWFGLK